MRNFIQIINEAQSVKFQLMPGLDPSNYVITNSIKDAEQWRAMTYVGDSETEADRIMGNMGPVGYIMIGLKDNTIIPIARGDEHHQGMDLLYDLAQGIRYNENGKKIKTKPLNFNPSDYYPVWAHGNNYAYEGDQSKMVTAVTKYLSYGGLDGSIKGMGGNSQMMHLSDFVKLGGLGKIEKGKIAPIGQKIIDSFAEIATSLRSRTDDSRVSTTPIFKQSVEFLKMLTVVSYETDLNHENIKKLLDKIRLLQKANDISGLENLIFGFHGIKNTIHTSLKQMIEKGDAWSRGRINTLWGDPELAADLLGRF